MRNSIRMRTTEQMRGWTYPSLIYFIGLVITATYVFTTKYYTVCDAGRQYEIYLAFINLGHWEDLGEIYGLQMSALWTTYIPAMLQRLTGLDPLVLFNGYNCAMIPFLPVVCYFIAKRFMSNQYAFLTSFFVMAQVVFLQGASIPRNIIALIFLGLVIVVAFNLNWSLKRKALAIISLCLAMVISHYTTVYLCIITLVVVLSASQLLKLLRKIMVTHRAVLGLACITLVLGSIVWLGIIVSYPTERGMGVAQGIIKGNTDPISVTSSTGDRLPAIIDIGTRDKIIQVALGRTNPEGDTTFSFSIVTFILSWLTIGLMSFGLYKAVRNPLDREYTVLAVVSYLAIVATVLIPYASQSYGIERVYQQALVVIAPFFVLGCMGVASRLKLKPLYIIMPVLIPYFYLMATTGVIHSLTGVAG